MLVVLLIKTVSFLHEVVLFAVEELFVLFACIELFEKTVFVFFGRLIVVELLYEFINTIEIRRTAKKM